MMFGKKMPPMKAGEKPAKPGEKAKPTTAPFPKRGMRTATHMMKKGKAK